MEMMISETLFEEKYYGGFHFSKSCIVSDDIGDVYWKSYDMMIKNRITL